ncbi:MAG: hypothetical protein ACLFWM_09230, partial [Actinomycetota bacterium]
VAAIHATWRREGRPYGDDVGERIDAALRVTDDRDAVAQGKEWRRSLTAILEEATAGGSLVVTPSVADMDKRIGDDRIGDLHYRTVVSWFSAPVNPTGLPAISAPVAGPGRQPSIQLIGSSHSEPLLMSTARLLEERGILEIGRWSSDCDAM